MDIFQGKIINKTGLVVTSAGTSPKVYGVVGGGPQDYSDQFQVGFVNNKFYVQQSQAQIEIHLTFTWCSPDHLTITWPSPDPHQTLT